MLLNLATEDRGPNPVVPPLGEIIIGLIAFGILALRADEVRLAADGGRPSRRAATRSRAASSGPRTTQNEAKRLLDRLPAAAGRGPHRGGPDPRQRPGRGPADHRGDADARRRRSRPGSCARGEEQLTVQRQQVVRELRGEIGALAVAAGRAGRRRVARRRPEPAAHRRPVPRRPGRDGPVGAGRSRRRVPRRRRGLGRGRRRRPARGPVMVAVAGAASRESLAAANRSLDEVIDRDRGPTWARPRTSCSRSPRCWTASTGCAGPWPTRPPSRTAGRRCWSGCSATRLGAATLRAARDCWCAQRWSGPRDLADAVEAARRAGGARRGGAPRRARRASRTSCSGSAGSWPPSRELRLLLEDRDRAGRRAGGAARPAGRRAGQPGHPAAAASRPSGRRGAVPWTVRSSELVELAAARRERYVAYVTAAAPLTAAAGAAADRRSSAGSTGGRCRCR